MTEEAKAAQPVHKLVGNGHQVACGKEIVGGDRVTDRAEDVTCASCAAA